MPTPAEIAFAHHQMTEELETQARIVLARDLYAGTIDPAMVTQLEAALLSGDASQVNALYNLYAAVVDEVADRLSVSDLMDTPEPRPGEDEDGQPIEWANDYWQLHGLDELQYQVMEDALVSGESFILLAPYTDPETQEVSIKPYHHGRYTSAAVGGDNQGMKVHYDGHHQAITMASKRWIETYYDDNNESKQRQRMTLYIAATAEEAARIEKYVIEEGIPVQFQDEGDEGWPIPWTDGSQSLPLPIIHFKAIGGQPLGHRAQGPQLMMDNLATVFLAAAGTQGYPMMWAIGGFPTTDGKEIAEDGSNLWKMGPGQLIGFPTKTPSEAEVGHVPPGDLEQILLAIDKAVIMTALTTGTPSLIADQLARRATSAEFIKQVDIRPTARVRKQQRSFGNSFSQLFAILVRLNNALATGENLPEDQPVHTRWLPADVRGLDDVPDVAPMGEGENDEIA